MSAARVAHAGGEAILNVHSVLQDSRANGPGRRAVVWLQGCSRRCPGCGNPQTWSHEPRRSVSARDLAGELLANAPDGITISGGEPCEQSAGVLALLRCLRAPNPRLSVLLFSGFTLGAIRRRALGPEMLALVDVLIAGPYRRARHLGAGLLGSANQRIHLLTPRHQRHELAAVPPAEIVIDARGVVTVSGVAVPRVVPIGLHGHG